MARMPRHSAPIWCAPMILRAMPPRCSCRRSNAGRCWRSMPSMSRSPGCASRSASRCPAKSACNGGPTCWQASAMAALKATRSRPNCCWRSENFRLPVERLSRLIDGASVRSLQRSDADRWRRWKATWTPPPPRCSRSPRGSAGHASDETEHLARHAGLAQGIAQVIAALPRDASRRQLFLPLQLLEQHGSGMEEVFAGKA